MDPVLEALKKELEIEASRDHVPIIRGPERALLLAAAEKASPKRILEIGTAIGYSSLLLAERFPLAEIDTLEIDPVRHARAEEVMRAAGFSQRVHCHLGDAAALLETLEGPYDFLYLDGPKGQYLRQLKAIEPKLSPHAVIAADNVLFRGMVESEAPVPHRYRTLVMRLREYIRYVKERYETTIYPEGDGLAVSEKLGVRSEEWRIKFIKRREVYIMRLHDGYQSNRSEEKQAVCDSCHEIGGAFAKK